MDSIHLDQRMIRKAEAAICNRTSRVTIVVERCTNDFNYSAILRTAEALGVQHVWIIAPPQIETILKSSTGKIVKGASMDEIESRAMHHLFAQNATEWLTVREFENTGSCLKELRRTGHCIWATDLSQDAVCLVEDELPVASNNSLVPEKLAVVFGTEAVGCSQELLEAADLRVYLPLRGFADSLNLSVATALVLQQLFWLDPTLIGDMPESERKSLRQAWFAKLAMQRLLTSAEKKNRSRMMAKLKQCQDIQRRLDQGETMDPSQTSKLQDMASIQCELDTLNHRLEEQAALAVKELVDNPPEPLTDMRRADEHRTCYVGKKTKKRSEQYWENMPATTGYNTSNAPSSADFFRTRVANATKDS